MSLSSLVIRITAKQTEFLAYIGSKVNVLLDRMRRYLFIDLKRLISNIQREEMTFKGLFFSSGSSLHVPSDEAIASMKSLQIVDFYS